MEKKTVFIKVSVKDRLPSDELFTVLTDKGKLFTFDVKECAKWWLEEIELPSDEEIFEASPYEQYTYDKAFEAGANYILNKLR